MQRGSFASPLALVFALLTGGPLDAADPPPAPSIAKLAEQLDSPRYQERHQAQQALVQRPLSELAPLRPLMKESPSAEVRSQLRWVFDAVEHRELAKAFAKLTAAKTDASIDLEEALWLVTLISDPNPAREELSRELDGLAALVRQRLPVDPPLAKQDPRKVMNTLHAVLYGEKKFRINFADYENLANASALEVLRKSRGLPITLGLVAICVGRRLNLPIEGVAAPGRYLVKYRMNAKEPFSPGDLYLDPLEEGRVATAEEVIQHFGDGNRIQIEPAMLLSVATHRATVRRMLLNVASAFGNLDDERRAARIQQYLHIVGEDETEKTKP